MRRRGPLPCAPVLDTVTAEYRTVLLPGRTARAAATTANASGIRITIAFSWVSVANPVSTPVAAIHA